MNKKQNEKIGDRFIFAEAFLWAFFPLLLAESSGILPPLFFAGISSVIAGITLLIIIFFFQRSALSFPKEALRPALIATCIILFIFYPLIFFGGQNAPSGNTALLLQAEVFFSFLFFGALGLERISIKRILGASIILMGSSIILFQGFSGNIGKGELYILLATAIVPLANHYQKEAMKTCSSLSYITYRNIFGGIILVGISMLFENIQQVAFSSKEILLLVANGVFAFGISKWFFLEGIKRIGVAKAISMNAIAPALTLFLAFILLQENPTPEQIFGVFTVIIGTLLVISPLPEIIFTGKTIRGDGKGKELGFPTINIQTTEKTPKGVYAAYAEINGEKYTGIVHCGPRPSFGKMEWRNEIHLLDFCRGEAVYSPRQTRRPAPTIPENTPITLFIEKRIRRVKKFSSVEKLQQRLEKDKKIAEEFFTKN